HEKEEMDEDRRHEFDMRDSTAPLSPSINVSGRPITTSSTIILEEDDGLDYGNGTHSANGHEGDEHGPAGSTLAVGDESDRHSTGDDRTTRENPTIPDELDTIPSSLARSRILNEDDITGLLTPKPMT
ncbi:hypothetical protein ADUPG1_004233, partial [Aduncisulcus paluster]